MILHFSNIGFTEALTFIAPVFVSTTGLLPVPGVGQAGTNLGRVGRPRKIAGGVLRGAFGWEAPRPSSPHAPKHARAKAPGGPASPRKLSEPRPTETRSSRGAGATDRGVSLPSSRGDTRGC